MLSPVKLTINPEPSDIVVLNPKHFVFDRDGAQKCFIKALGGEEVCVVIGPESLELSVFLKDKHEWKLIPSANLPKEFQQSFNPALETLVKVATFTVSILRNDDCQLELQVHEEEQMGRLARMAERELREQELLKRMLPTVQEKLSIGMDHFALTPVGQFIGNIDPLASLGVVGGIAATAGVIMVAATGGVLLIPTLIISGGLALGFIASLALGCHLKDKQEEAEDVARLIANAQNCFQNAQTHYLNQNEDAVILVVNDFIKELIRHKFVKESSPHVFEFDETRFKSMANLYLENDAESVCAMMKLLILFSVELLPQRNCPSAAILVCLEKINTDNIPENIKDYIFLVKGRLNLNNGDRGSAKTNFQSISEESDLYRFAKEYLGVIAAFEPQSRLG